MERQNRYIVVKRKDAEKHLTATERSILLALSAKVACGREFDGKNHLECVVVESDWPEYEPTWAAIERRVDGGAEEPAA
jgi:hypothetical protein